MPFLQRQCACDADTIVVGHSSGAVACMRLLESTRLRGAVLVSACHTDLGDAGERAAGYYSRPWQVSYTVLSSSIGRTVHLGSIAPQSLALNVLHSLCMQWTEIRANSDWIIQFHSTDDPFIPPEEARHVAKSLHLHTYRLDSNSGNGDSAASLPPLASAGGYYEFGNRSHFFREFDELIQSVGMKLGQL